MLLRRVDRNPRRAQQADDNAGGCATAFWCWSSPFGRFAGGGAGAPAGSPHAVLVGGGFQAVGSGTVAGPMAGFPGAPRHMGTLPYTPLISRRGIGSELRVKSKTRAAEGVGETLSRSPSSRRAY